MGSPTDVSAEVRGRVGRLPGRLREALRYVGPGFLVTAGFIDPGNWASNLAAGSRHGYALLWVVTASSVLLGIVQHAAARLGIGSGLCLAEASTRYLPRALGRAFLASGLVATSATLFAELLGVAIGLQMLTGLPLRLGSTLAAVAVALTLGTSGYRALERWLVGLVSLVGFGFVYEVVVAPVDWGAAAPAAVVPTVPAGAAPLVAAIVGAVVMPHGVFLHSEAIQSRAWHVGTEEARRGRLRYEALDTGLAVVLGWAINCAMIIAMAAFFAGGPPVTELSEAHAALEPTFGRGASTVFALALVASGFAASLTAAMAAGSIGAGAAGRPFVRGERSGTSGIVLALAGALAAALLGLDPLRALIGSQVLLSVQLPFTLVVLAVLASSRRIARTQAEPRAPRVLLWLASALIVALNVAAMVQALR